MDRAYAPLATTWWKDSETILAISRQFLYRPAARSTAQHVVALGGLHRDEEQIQAVRKNLDPENHDWSKVPRVWDHFFLPLVGKFFRRPKVPQQAQEQASRAKDVDLAEDSQFTGLTGHRFRHS